MQEDRLEAAFREVFLKKDCPDDGEPYPVGVTDKPGTRSCMRENVFAYTEPGMNCPRYISLNRDADGKYRITMRERNISEQMCIEIPERELGDMAVAIKKYLVGSDGVLIGEKDIPVSMAIHALSLAMREDFEYAWSWQCNLAMMAYDAGADRKMANARAASLMDGLFNVKVYEHQRYRDIMDEPDHRRFYPVATARPFKKAPQLLTVDGIHTHVQFRKEQVEIDGQWVPARGEGTFGFWSRLKKAWMVFCGQADAVIWPGQ